MKQILDNIIVLLEQEGFKVKTYTDYGRYFIEFEYTGIRVKDFKRIIEYLPRKSIITSSRNGSLCIDTGIINK